MFLIMTNLTDNKCSVVSALNEPDNSAERTVSICVVPRCDCNGRKITRQ